MKNNYTFKNSYKAWILLFTFFGLNSTGYAQTDFNEVRKIVASDRGQNDSFGLSVSISGNYAIVGAPFEMFGAGSAYIFERDGSGTWIEVQKLVASDSDFDDRFGWSVF